MRSSILEVISYRIYRLASISDINICSFYVVIHYATNVRTSYMSFYVYMPWLQIILYKEVTVIKFYQLVKANDEKE